LLVGNLKRHLKVIAVREKSDGFWWKTEAASNDQYEEGV
jgi:hypothetical protein